MKRFSFGILVVGMLCGCGSKNASQNAGGPQAAASAASGTNGRKRSNTDPSTAIAQRQLGDGEMRLALLVFPGDTIVEIDKAPAMRRNGMIELVGRVGDERRIEVFLDAATKIEKIVKIEATGVSPALIDAEEELRLRSGPGKTPVVFDINE
jgi:hypothetical protein